MAPGGELIIPNTNIITTFPSYVICARPLKIMAEERNAGARGRDPSGRFRPIIPEFSGIPGAAREPSFKRKSFVKTFAFDFEPIWWGVNAGAANR